MFEQFPEAGTYLRSKNKWYRYHMLFVWLGWFGLVLRYKDFSSVVPKCCGAGKINNPNRSWANSFPNNSCLLIRIDILEWARGKGGAWKPVHFRNINVDLLQKKIQNLEQDNRKLHAEASKVLTYIGSTVRYVLTRTYCLALPISPRCLKGQGHDIIIAWNGYGYVGPY